MNAFETKNLMTEMLKYFVDNPKIYSKRFLPPELLEKLLPLKSLCPLCDFFKYTDRRDSFPTACWPCPLGDCSSGSAYCKWFESTTDGERKNSAQEGLDKVRAWDVEKYN